ncbi:hypothetical protein PGT21_008378 [Puccinia graminis f. sp. tritici]|uniref:Uncharacterized protein n=1 Tax=Puccinia graminis f. sp. tritici TaxID=56615 RepID=A0A5B0PDT3_PUCGR|nr:hypothetical protein PGT21_008378 [Puccinia graminis f. sp. tritici]
MIQLTNLFKLFMVIILQIHLVYGQFACSDTSLPFCARNITAADRRRPRGPGTKKEDVWFILNPRKDHEGLNTCQDLKILRQDAEWEICCRWSDSASVGLDPMKDDAHITARSTEHGLQTSCCTPKDRPVKTKLPENQEILVCLFAIIWFNR